MFNAPNTVHVRIAGTITPVYAKMGLWQRKMAFVLIPVIPTPAIIMVCAFLELQYSVNAVQGIMVQPVTLWRTHPVQLAYIPHLTANPVIVILRVCWKVFVMAVEDVSVM